VTGSGSWKMNQEFENSQEFLKNLDRLLAGEKIVIDPAAEKELAAALDFAQKIKGLRAVPSAEFTAQLKAKLLNQIAQSEEAARVKKARGWWANFTANRVVWQTVTAVLVICLITGLLWATNFLRFPGGAPSTTPIVSATTTTSTTAIVSVTTTNVTTTATSTTNPGTSTAPSGPLVVKAGTDQTAYAAGDNVKINVAITNVTYNTIVIPAYPPILSLMQADSSQPVYTFAAGPLPRTISPGETANFELNWNQLDAKGQEVPAGSYYIELEDINTGGRTIKLNLTSPVRFNILPPTTTTAGQERTISVKQSQTDGSITVALSSVIVDGNNYVWVTADITGGAGNATADYSLDSGWMKDARPPVVTGTQYLWHLPVSISPENSELIFIITGIGNQTGYWEFHIPLK
jgi:hypothetical protein